MQEQKKKVLEALLSIDAILRTHDRLPVDTFAEHKGSEEVEVLMNRDGVLMAVYQPITEPLLTLFSKESRQLLYELLTGSPHSKFEGVPPKRISAPIWEWLLLYSRYSWLEHDFDSGLMVAKNDDWWAVQASNAYFEATGVLIDTNEFSFTWDMMTEFIENSTAPVHNWNNKHVLYNQSMQVRRIWDELSTEKTRKENRTKFRDLRETIKPHFGGETMIELDVAPLLDKIIERAILHRS
jgi:hypothetical protein